MVVLPSKVRAQVLERVLAEAEELGWEHLSQPEKTNRLAYWVQAPNIGQTLLPLLGDEMSVRVWLKETALKAYSRKQLPTAEFIVERVFQGGAVIKPGSTGIKPPHCIAVVRGKQHYVCWGHHANASNLVWAALNAVAGEQGIAEAHVAITNKGLSLTPRDKRAKFETIAVRCGLDVTWIES